MDYETADPADIGQSLSGIGINLLSRDVPALSSALTAVLGLSAYRVSSEFALIVHGTQLIQIHADTAFANHPVGVLAGEAALRGAGVQIYLFGLDPDAVASRARVAESHSISLLEEPADKPHGLREASIATPEGYVFTAARSLTPKNI